MSLAALRSRRVLIGGQVRPASVHIEGGVIAAVRDYADVTGDVDDVGDALVMAGLFDGHVHINEPGRTEWEGFETATAAAAAGGITTVVDMPLNCIPVTTTVAALAEKARHAAGRCAVDYAFWGGVVPGNAGELDGMIDAGVHGFKCFLVHSGVDDFPNVTERDLREAMPILARRGAVLLVHAELPGPIDAAAADLARSGADPCAYATFLRSRPRASENEAVAQMIRLCRELRCPVHIVHLSSSDAVPLLAEARREGLPITSETCPHYLTFAAEEIPDGLTAFKCCPPVRERDNRERLWAALADGSIDFVVSDHSPCVPALKQLDSGDFLAAWGGISSLQVGLSAVWAAASQRGHGLAEIAAWMCERPARLAGLERRKGILAPGHDADLVVWDPAPLVDLDPSVLRHRHKLSPYAGRTLRGVVQATYLRGERIYDHGELVGPPRGRRIGGLSAPAAHGEDQ
jgi:allantoinase